MQVIDARGNIKTVSDDYQIRDGERLRTSMTMMDAADPELVAKLDEIIHGRHQQRDTTMTTRTLHDGLGGLAGMKPGYVFGPAMTTDAARRRGVEANDFAKAELSARWKGGLQEGDQVRLGDRCMEVIGVNAETGKMRLADASEVDRETLLADAYSEYNDRITEAWRGNDKSRKGTQRDPAGREKSTFSSEEEDPDENEWKLAGPLSDSERQAVLDSAYAEYEQRISSAWKR